MITRLRYLGTDVREGVRTRPGRFLTAWGAVLMAVTLLTLLTAVLGGLEMRAQGLRDDLGANVFALVSAAPATLPGRGLSRRHLSILAASLPDCRVGAAHRTLCRVGTGDARVSVFAVFGAFVEIRAWQVHAGRLLDDTDERRRDRHAVLGRGMADRHGLSVADFISFNGLPFQVAGVLSEQVSPAAGALPGGDAVYVPWCAASTLVHEAEPANRLDVILVRVPPGRAVAESVAAARRALGRPELQGVTWVTPESLVEGVRKLQKTVGMAAGGVVVLCLLMAAATLVSLMLLTVRERVAEIGLRRAIGARPVDVAALFLVEGLIITGTAAGAAGCLSAVVLHLAAARMPLPLRTDVGIFWLPFVVSLALGAACAWFPAYYAARLRPADALRTE